MFELLIATFVFAGTARYAGPQGRSRFERISDKRARGIHDHFASRGVDWILVFFLAGAVVNAALSLYLGVWPGVALSLTAAALMAAARAMRPAARANVNAAFADRGLEPLTQRERSARRDRRQLQFGTVALAGYLAGQVLQAVHVKTGEGWPQVLALPATLMMLGGGLALLWSTAWRFGDEQPVHPQRVGDSG